jgi:hypothetical protein
MPSKQAVYRVLCLMFLAFALSSCAQFLRPVEPGGSLIEKSGVALVFGRISVIRDGQDQMTAMPNILRNFGWTLMRAESGKRYVSEPLTENGIFALYLPGGIYHVTKLVYEDRAGIWEGSLAATFIVKPTGLTYVGTWEITFAGLGQGVPITGRTLNMLEQERDEFVQRYKISAASIAIALMETAREGYLSLLRPRAEQ